MLHKVKKMETKRSKPYNKKHSMFKIFWRDFKRFLKLLLKKILGEKKGNKVCSILFWHWYFITELLAYRVAGRRRFYVCHKRKILYFDVQKAASTTIKAKLSNLTTRDTRSVHAALLSHTYFGIHKKFRSFYKFTFVRNPLTRVVSCFEDKILRKESEHEENPYTFYLFGCLSHVTSFDHFVRTICKIPDFLAESHFRSQYFLIYQYDKNLKLDFIGKIENKKDFEFIDKKLNLKNVKPLNVTSKGKIRLEDYYTEELLELVHKRYKKDFVHFGYEKEYQELKQRLRKNKGKLGGRK